MLFFNPLYERDFCKIKIDPREKDSLFGIKCEANMLTTSVLMSNLSRWCGPPSLSPAQSVLGI